MFYQGLVCDVLEPGADGWGLFYAAHVLDVSKRAETPIFKLSESD